MSDITKEVEEKIKSDLKSGETLCEIKKTEIALAVIMEEKVKMKVYTEDGAFLAEVPLSALGE